MEGVSTIAAGALKRYRTVRDSALLAASWINSETMDVHNIKTLAALVVYAMGAGETANAIVLRLAISDDGANWYYDTGGTTPLSPAEHTYTSVTAAGVNNMFAKTWDVSSAAFARIQVKETGVASNYGTARVSAALAPW